MKINSIAVGVLFSVAPPAGLPAWAGAQGDSVSHAAATAAGAANGSATFAAPDTSKPEPRCWTGCTGTIGHVSLADWQNAQFRRDGRELQARRDQDPLAARNGSGALPAALPSRPLPSAPTTRSAQAPSMSPEEAWRYSIEEWRRAELAVVDSVHHAVLIRLAHTFDSAQGVSPEERPRILGQVDGLNHVNQLMWLERVWEVNRQADSAIRAIPVSP